MLHQILHKSLGIPYSLNATWFSKPKSYRATIVFVHGIGSSAKMWNKVAKRLPGDVRAIGIDLLGFGQSPKPDFKKYDIRDHSLSLALSMPKLNITKPVILVGHSLGTLVSIDLARRYPLLVSSLILCSPPIYSMPDDQIAKEKRLYRFYAAIATSKLARQLLIKSKPFSLINPGYMVDRTNVEIFLKTLIKSIVEQNSLNQISKIRKPINIIYGKLDPFIIERNITFAQTANPSIAVTRFKFAGHEFSAAYRHVVLDILIQHISRKKTNNAV